MANDDAKVYDAAASSKRRDLTIREMQILSAVASGKTNREIAEQFCVSNDAVRRCVKGLCLKIGTEGRLELVLSAIYYGLVS